MTNRDIADSALEAFDSFAEDAAVGRQQDKRMEAVLQFDLNRHDQRFHPGGYREGTQCKYRDRMAAAMRTSGLDPSHMKDLGKVGALASAPTGGEAEPPSEAERKFLDLKARFEREGQTEISHEAFVKARYEYLLSVLGEAEAECVKRLEDVARSGGVEGERAVVAATRIIEDPASSNAQREGARAVLEARREWKVGDKTYVDLTQMDFMESLAEAFRAGFEGKGIVTDLDKASGRWDAIRGSDPEFAKENGLLQDGVKDALADIGFGEDFAKAAAIAGLSDEQKKEIAYQKLVFEQAEGAKEKHAAWVALKKYLREQGLEKDGNRGGKTMKPLDANYPGPLAGDDLLDPETGDADDRDYGEKCAAKLYARLHMLGLAAAGPGEAHVGPSATVVEFPVNPWFNVAKARSKMANLGAAIGAQISSVGYAPGKTDTLRIEFTNGEMRKVGFADVIKSKAWKDAKGRYAIPTAIGKSSSGETIVHDDAKMPHEVVTGETGSGKSVYLQAKINSAQMAKTPQEYRQVLIDPKRQEFGSQTGSPYNLFPVQFTTEGAARAISLLRSLMEDRAAKLGVSLDEYDETKNEHVDGANASLQSYNDRQTDPKKRLPFVKVYIDELAALTKDPAYGPQIEADLDQLMAKARSVGISFTLSSQRNDVASIKGSIAANAPSRMIFKAAADDAKASRAAKSLAGVGDFIHIDKTGRQTRGRACFISDGEKERIPAFYRNQAAQGTAQGAVE